MSDKADLNALRWVPAKTRFFETHYVMWNAPDGSHSGWVRYTNFSSPTLGQEAAVWGIFKLRDQPERNLAVRQLHPLTALAPVPGGLTIGDSGLTTDRAWGQVASGERTMAWDLHVDQPGPAVQHFPPLLYHTPLPTTKFLAPTCWYGLAGHVTLDGERFEIAGARAHQAHFWGHKQVEAWTWGNCAEFAEDPEFAFEGVVGYLKTFLPALSIFIFRYRGKVIACNGLTQCFITSKSRHELETWRFEARDGALRFRGEMRARPDQMVLYQHVDPDGAVRYSHNDLAAALTITVERLENGTWSPVDTYTSARGARYEVAQPTHDARVTSLVQLAEPARQPLHS